MTWGALDGQNSVWGRELFVVKYESAGEKKWTQLIGTPADLPDIGYGITSDSNGNIYITGSTYCALGGQTSAGGYDLFMVAYSREANLAESE